MALNYPRNGLNHVGAYQVSAIPFVTSSVPNEVPGPDSNSLSKPITVTFPFVTRFLTVRNTGPHDMRIGFSQDGIIAPGERLASENSDKAPDLTRNYFILPSSGSVHQPGSTQTFEIRCKAVHFLTDVAESTDGTSNGTSSFTLLAGLTSIESTQFPVLSSSNGFGGIG